MIRERVTIAQFEAFIAEQQDTDYEFIGGEIVPVVSDSYASHIAAKFLMRIGLFVEDHQLGYVTGADGGYIVGDERYLPDVGFISKATIQNAPRETYIPHPPDLAIEVKSPTDQNRLLTVKVSNYLAAGTIVWVVYPEEAEVHVHQSGKSVMIYTAADTLTDDTVLAGFTVDLSRLFVES